MRKTRTLRKIGTIDFVDDPRFCKIKTSSHYTIIKYKDRKYPNRAAQRREELEGFRDFIEFDQLYWSTHHMATQSVPN